MTNDILIEACTKDGLLCRNADQTTNETCRDYEIKFECLGKYFSAPDIKVTLIFSFFNTACKYMYFRPTKMRKSAGL